MNFQPNGQVAHVLKNNMKWLAHSNEEIAMTNVHYYHLLGIAVKGRIDRNIMKIVGYCQIDMFYFRHTFLAWPYMVSCGAIQWSLTWDGAVWHGNCHGNTTTEKPVMSLVNYE